MKKAFAPLFILISSILSFVLMCGSWVRQEPTDYTYVTNISGWEFLQFESGVNGFLMFKIFAIAMLILAIVIIVLSLLKFLKSLDIIKFDVSVILFVVCVIYALSSIGLTIGTSLACSALSINIGSIGFYYNPDICVFIQLILGILVGILSLFQVRKKERV